MSSSPGSSAIAIPKRKRKQHFHGLAHTPEQPERRAAESPTPSSLSMSGRSSFGSVASPRDLGKSPVTDTVTGTQPIAVSPAQADRARNRRCSFLSDSLAKSEYTVIDVGSEDSPRLITCVKASQGFNWNPEIFLPSYLNHGFEPLERRQDPVEDIIITDEEAAALLPQ